MSTCPLYRVKRPLRSLYTKLGWSSMKMTQLGLIISMSISRRNKRREGRILKDKLLRQDINNYSEDLNIVSRFIKSIIEVIFI